MGKGGIFNQGNVLGATDEKDDELTLLSKAPGVSFNQQRLPGVDLLRNNIELEAIDQPDAPVAAPAPSGFWANLSDTGRLLVAVAGIIGAYVVYKGITKKVRPASYSENKRKRRAKRNRDMNAMRTKWNGEAYEAGYRAQRAGMGPVPPPEKNRHIKDEGLAWRVAVDEKNMWLMGYQMAASGSTRASLSENNRRKMRARKFPKQFFQRIGRKGAAAKKRAKQGRRKP